MQLAAAEHHFCVFVCCCAATIDEQNASSAFGAFLDPVADKLMVAAVLVLLSTQPIAAGPFAGNTWIVPVATLGEAVYSMLGSGM